MKPMLTCALAALALAGCASNASVGQGAYALAAALDTAEELAAAYEQSPAADPVIVAQIKALDARAYGAVQPVTADANNATADELLAAQGALSALTQFLTQHGGN